MSRMLRRHHRARRAFSMIELVVVVTVMVALAGSSVPTFQAWQAATADRAAGEVVRNIAVRAQNQAVAGDGVFLAEDVDEVVYNTAPDAGAASEGISALTDFEPTEGPSSAYGQVSTSPLAGGQELGVAMETRSGSCAMAYTTVRGAVQVDVVAEDLGDGCHGMFAGCIQAGNCTPRDPGPPGPPELCVVGGSCVAADEQVTLAWGAPPSNDISHYEIYSRANEPGGGASCDPASGPGVRVGGNVTATTLVVQDLANTTRYCFWAFTVDTTGQRSVASNGVVLTPVDQTAPTTPALSATALVRSARLDWTASTDEFLAGYRLYRSTENTTAEPANASFQLLATVDAPTTTYTDTGTAPQGLTPGTRYWYKVEAFDDNANTSPRSNAASVVPNSGSLSPPAVTATGAVKRVFLTWTAGPDPFGERTGYTISRNGTQIATVPANATGYTDDTNATLADNTTYTYTVVATDALGGVSTPATVSATTIAAPSNLAAAAGQNQVTVSWAARVGAGEYDLEWATPATVVTTSSTTLTQTELANSLTRSYRVRACATYPTAPAPQRVCTDYTAPVSATTTPGAPTLAATSGQPNQIPLTWGQAANTATADTSYELQRRIATSGTWATQAPDPTAPGTRYQVDLQDPYAPPTVDTNPIADGQAYDYRIRARGPGGTGPWSPTVTAASMALPSAPTVAPVNCPKGYRTWLAGGRVDDCTALITPGTGPGTVTTTGRAEERVFIFGTAVFTARGTFSTATSAPVTWTSQKVRATASGDPATANLTGVYFTAETCNEAGCRSAERGTPAVPRPTPWGGSVQVNGVWTGTASGPTPVKTYCIFFHCEFRMTADRNYPGFEMNILFGNYGPGNNLYCNDCWAYSYNNWVGGATQVPRTNPGNLPFLITPRTNLDACNRDTCTLHIGVPFGTAVWGSPASWASGNPTIGTDGWCRPGQEVADVGPGYPSCGYGTAVS